MVCTEGDFEAGIGEMYQYLGQIHYFRSFQRNLARSSTPLRDAMPKMRGCNVL